MRFDSDWLWHLVYIFIGAIAVIIDAVVLHAHLFILGFDVPEVPEYFISKLAIVAITTAIVIHTVGYKLKAAAIAAVAGSSAFSLYYAISRPSIISDGLYPPLQGHEYQVYDLQTSAVIWLVHAIAIFVGFLLVMQYRKKGRKR